MVTFSFLLRISVKNKFTSGRSQTVLEMSAGKASWLQVHLFDFTKGA